MCPDYRLQSQLQPAAMLAGWYNKLTAVMLACCGCWCVWVCVCVCCWYLGEIQDQPGWPKTASTCQPHPHAIHTQLLLSISFNLSSLQSFLQIPILRLLFVFHTPTITYFDFHPKFKFLDQSLHKQYFHEFGFFPESFWSPRSYFHKPTIITDFHVNLSLKSWVTTIYIFICNSPPFL